MSRVGRHIMRDMISVASGFQYSVNIGYDLGCDDKLRNFIPTKSALSLLEEILLSIRRSLVVFQYNRPGQSADWSIW